MYSFKSKVRYSEINRQGKLDIPSVINYFQDCSNFQSEELGIGMEYLKKTGKAWLLNSWQIEFLEDAELLDDIEAGTWAYGYNSIYGYRNFVLNRADGTRLVNADSVWVFTDISTGKPIKVMPEDVEQYGEEAQIEMTDYGRKIITAGDGRDEEPFRIRKYHIDTNGHVNNGRYVQFAMEYLDDNRRVKVLRVQYKKAAVYGNVIYPQVFHDENTVTVSLNDDTGKPYAKVQFIM